MFEVFWAGLTAILVSQLLKAFYSRNVRSFLAVGGMPSSHTALVTAVTVSVAFVEGFSSLFFVSLAFAVIVVHDALKVRKQHTGWEVFSGVVVGALSSVIHII